MQLCYSFSSIDKPFQSEREVPGVPDRHDHLFILQAGGIRLLSVQELARLGHGGERRRCVLLSNPHDGGYFLNRFTDDLDLPSPIHSVRDAKYFSAVLAMFQVTSTQTGRQ